MKVGLSKLHQARISRQFLSRFFLPSVLFSCVIGSGCHHPLSEDKLSQQKNVTRELLPGLGTLHHSIRTSNLQAQQFFDQGLTLIYAFNFGEAVRAFGHASELDPRAAMPYWGTALALGPNYNSGYVSPAAERAANEAVGNARALSKGGPEEEKAYVEALARRFNSSPDADSSSRNRYYAAAMREVTRRYPDDPDAAILYAASLMDLHPKKLWSNVGKPTEDTVEVMAVLEQVLERWPEHIGANHFYIHALEASPFPDRARANADRLRTLAPGAGHLVHMPAHIYARTGDYAAAVASTSDAAAIDAKYLRDHADNDAYDLLYAQHNLSFLAAVAGTEGDFTLAYKTAKDLESKAYATLVEAPMSESYSVGPLLILLRFGRWNEVIEMPAPPADLQGLNFYWHFARGCAFANQGSASNAEVERTAMEDSYRRLPGGWAFGMLPNDWETIHDIASRSLDARIAATKGNFTSAVNDWREAAETQDRMNYHEPPDWYYPVRESWGAALFRNKEFAKAEEVFRSDLARNANNPRSLYGLYRTLQSEHKTVEAGRLQKLFESVWRGNTSQLHIEDF